MTTSPVMELLARRVPITLLLDLVPADGPDSRGICAAERPERDQVWDEAATSERVRAVG